MDFDYYKIASAREREELASFFKKFKSINQIEYTEGNVVYDAVINNEILVECKVRDCNDYIYEMIKNEGVLLEKDKYIYLNRSKDNLGMKKIFYISFFPKQNEILLFDLSSGLELNETVKKCNKQTYSHNSTKIEKKIYLLDYNQAKRFHF